ncbi:MAG TPA: LPXTG cell wall anchor domain-containing protein, partial [Acidimicrobiia bacterium]|nr:LPXTG cell wall anchor domain-containing protein [Acidimicrobiia bacterium]
GSLADCAKQQGGAEAGSSPTGVGGAVQAAICGNGVAGVGTGTAANCVAQQGGTNPDGSTVTPQVPVVVCGNGAGVGGAGSEAVCGAEVRSEGPTSPPAVQVGPNVIVPAAVSPSPAAAAGRRLSTGGALPVTGGTTTVVLLGMGVAMIAAGTAAVRLRRRMT